MSKPNKIFYVCGGRSFFKRDPGRKIFEVVRCWEELGFDIEHICGGDVDLPPPTETSENGATQAIQSHPSRSGWRTRFPAIANSISEYRDIRHDKRVFSYLMNLAGSKKPDLVWERSCRLHDAGLRFARETGVPYVLEWKDHLVNYKWSAWRKRALALEAHKNREADWIVVESNILKQELAESGVESEKIIVAHNAIDPDIFAPDATLRDSKRKELGAEANTVLVGYLGSYSFYHNTALLIQAAKKTTTPNLRFVLIGDGLEVNECRELARSTAVLDRNLFMLPRTTMEQVPGILCALDIAVLPGSTDIICPIKIQEYMASGTATVAPDYFCNREVLDSDQLGVLFEPHNATALATAIDELAGNHDNRSQIAKQGRRHVQDNFTWQATWGRAMENIVASYSSQDVANAQ